MQSGPGENKLDFQTERPISNPVSLIDAKQSGRRGDVKWHAAGTVWKVSNKQNGATSGSGYGNRATYRLFAVLLLLFLIAIFIIPEARKIVLSIRIRYQSAFLLLNKGKK